MIGSSTLEIAMRPLVLGAVLLAVVAPLVAQTPSAPTPAPPSAAAPLGYGAWFGSVPDMDQSGAGIVLRDVTAGSPAAKAGLRAGDVVVEMAGEETPSLVEMVAVLRSHAPGETIDVVFFRGEERQTVKVTLAARPGA